MKRTERDINMSEVIYNYLHGELSGDEEEMLEAWLREPKNMDFFLKMKNTDILYEGLLEMDDVDTDSSFAFLEARMNKDKRIRFMKYFIGVAAVAAVCFTSMFFLHDMFFVSRDSSLENSMCFNNCAKLKTFEGELLYLQDTVKHINLKADNLIVSQNHKSQNKIQSKQREVAYNTLTAPEHGHIKISLYDGSKVWLNSGSSLKYPAVFNNNKREVFLRGEAFFEVSKDSLRPFSVNTTVGSIDVLGTSFNVNAYDQERCVTTLVSGCVKMRNNCKESVVIYPGQQVVINANGLMNVNSVDVRYYMAWRNNLFAFKDCSLAEIMKSLEEWYDVRIVFENIELSHLRYTTMVQKYETVDSVLNLLSGVEEFRCKKQAENIFIIKR